VKAPTRNLGDKLSELGRRSPKHVHAVEVLVDLALETLGPEAEASKPYTWRCDSPDVLNPKPKAGKP
jgi:hypothetical protein